MMSSATLVAGLAMVLYLSTSSEGALAPALCERLPMCRAPPPNCRHKTDARGCMTCELDCVEPCGPVPMCAAPPPNCRHKKDARGCMTCELDCGPCGPLPPCAAPPPNCRHKVDERGCMTCALDCGPPLCDLLHQCPKCLNGHRYITDENGCRVCKCNPRIICDLLHRPCPPNCRYGYEHYTDGNGCRRCRCKPNPIDPLPCHQYMKCANGVCPNSCRCKPLCFDIEGPDHRDIMVQ